MSAATHDRLARVAWGFATDGYAVLERFLDRACVAALRDEADAALRTPAASGCERPHNRLVPLRWSDRAIGLVLERPARARVVATVTAARDLRWISGYVSTKEPFTPALCWHQDWWCWDHPVSLRPAAAQVALLCYLIDTSEHNGALRILPRSHRASVPLHATLRDAEREDRSLPRHNAALSDQPGQVSLGVRAGDAVLLDYRLLHGTHPNASPERRDCVLLSFAPSWADLPRDIRAHLIQHPAQPMEDERPFAGWASELLPRFAGRRADLPMNRRAPDRFAVH